MSARIKGLEDVLHIWGAAVDLVFSGLRPADLVKENSCHKDKVYTH